MYLCFQLLCLLRMPYRLGLFVLLRTYRQDHDFFFMYTNIGAVQIWTDGPVQPQKEGPTPTAGLPSIISIFVDEKFKIGIFLYVISICLYKLMYIYFQIYVYTYVYI
jgi:hypothetical protein